MYQFNDQGTLRDFAVKQDNFLTNIMIRRGLLTLDDTIFKHKNIHISGPAKSYLRLKVKDSTALDSIPAIEEFEL